MIFGDGKATLLYSSISLLGKSTPGAFRLPLLQALGLRHFCRSRLSARPQALSEIRKVALWSNELGLGIG